MSLEAYSARWEHSIEYLIRHFGPSPSMPPICCCSLALVRRRLVEADGLRLRACSSDQYAVADCSRRGWNMDYRLYSPPLSVGTHADHQDVGAVGRFFRLSVRRGICRRVDHANAQACCAIASCFARKDKMSERFTAAADMSPQSKEI